MQQGKLLNLPPGSLYAPLPIPAFQVLSNATEYAAQKVFLALVMHMGKNNNCVWPSYTQIAQDVGISRNSISKGLTALYNFGFIRIAKFPEGKQWRSRYYLQDCSWNSGLMKAEAKSFREKKYRCFACLKLLDRGDFGMSGDKRVHYGCGGFVIPAVIRKPRNNPYTGGGISQDG